MDSSSLTLSHPSAACITMTRRRRNHSTSPCSCESHRSGAAACVTSSTFGPARRFCPSGAALDDKRLRRLSAWTRMRAVHGLGVKVSWKLWSKRRLASGSMGFAQGRSHLRRPPTNICASSSYRVGEERRNSEYYVSKASHILSMSGRLHVHSECDVMPPR
jgi:hypothetical protein